MSTTPTCKAYSTTHPMMWRPYSITPKSPWTLALWTNLLPLSVLVATHRGRPCVQLWPSFPFLVRWQHGASSAAVDGHSTNTGCTNLQSLVCTRCPSVPTLHQPSHIKKYPIASIKLYFPSHVSPFLLYIFGFCFPPHINTPSPSLVPSACKLYTIWYQHVPKAPYPLNHSVSMHNVECEAKFFLNDILCKFISGSHWPCPNLGYSRKT